MKQVDSQIIGNEGHIDIDWAGFPGGELEGRRPKTLCPACRLALQEATAATARHQRSQGQPTKPLCFQCYRASIERERALKAAGEVNTASEARFQSMLPFEPVNQVRLTMLKVERARAHTQSSELDDRRRRAQIEARRVLERLAAGLVEQRLAKADRLRQIDAAIHAAELQLPESWIPFVVAR
jgi:hypothetical protein